MLKKKLSKNNINIIGKCDNFQHMSKNKRSTLKTDTKGNSNVQPSSKNFAPIK